MLGCVLSRRSRRRQRRMLLRPEVRNWPGNVTPMAVKARRNRARQLHVSRPIRPPQLLRLRRNKTVLKRYRMLQLLGLSRNNAR